MSGINQRAMLSANLMLVVAWGALIWILGGGDFSHAETSLFI